MLVQSQLAQAESNLMIAEVLKRKEQPKLGSATLKVDLQMPTLHDTSFEFWRHWHACQNVARCQTAGSALNEMDFLSMWINRFLPEGGVRATTLKTLYDRAARKGRLPSEAPLVLTEMRGAVSLLLAETELERSQRLEQMWNEIEQGNTTHAEFRAK